MKVTSADNYVSLVLGPLTIDEFMRDHWEREPLHIERHNDAHFTDLVNVQDIEELLSTQSLRFPDVQLSRRDDPVAPTSYTDENDRVIPLRLLDYHHQGATIVISQAQRLIASLAQFRREFQLACGMRCQTNLYLSPPGKQGFNVHYDSHDVFILQVAGSKTFHFHEGGVELPYSHERFDVESHQVGDFSQSISMQAGDTLYIPRGVMHDAVANEGQASLHITLGVYAITLRDTLLEMVSVLAGDDTRYRASAHQNTLDALLAPAFSREHLEEALRRLGDEVALDLTQDCRGSLQQSLTPLGVDSLVRIKPGRSRQFERVGSLVRYRIPGQILEFADPMGAALEQLLTGGPHRLSALGNLQEDQCLALCQTLLRANLLEIV